MTGRARVAVGRRGAGPSAADTVLTTRPVPPGEAVAGSADIRIPAEAHGANKPPLGLGHRQCGGQASDWWERCPAWSGVAAADLFFQVPVQCTGNGDAGTAPQRHLGRAGSGGGRGIILQHLASGGGIARDGFDHELPCVRGGQHTLQQSRAGSDDILCWLRWHGVASTDLPSNEQYKLQEEHSHGGQLAPNLLASCWLGCATTVYVAQARAGRARGAPASRPRHAARDLYMIIGPPSRSTLMCRRRRSRACSSVGWLRHRVGSDSGCGLATDASPGPLPLQPVRLRRVHKLCWVAYHQPLVSCESGNTNARACGIISGSVLGVVVRNEFNQMVCDT
jgi:hypothetical protein